MPTRLLAVALFVGAALDCMAEDEDLAQFNKTAAAAETARSRTKRPDHDIYLEPIVNGLVSDNPAIRDRAVELMIPYVRDGWIAVDQFERITWDRCDARGKGLFLWCAARRIVWDTLERTYPLKAEAIYDLWREAAKQPVPLPYLKELAETWFKLRGSSWKPVRLGDGLEAAERKRIARWFLSALRNCETPRERLAVIWMVIDLHVDTDDTALAEWYSNETDPGLRMALLESLARAARPSREEDPSYERGVMEKSRTALKQRLPALMALAQLALKDWHADAAEAGRSLIERLENL